VANYTGAGGRQNRTDTSDYATDTERMCTSKVARARIRVLRTVTSLHFQNQSQAEAFTTHRAFIQWAGFTFGTRKASRTSSSSIVYLQCGTLHRGSSDGNGTKRDGLYVRVRQWLTGTLAVEERRQRATGRSVVNLSSPTALVVGATAVDSSNGERFPDLQAILRYDQAWGTLAIWPRARCQRRLLHGRLRTAGHHDLRPSS